MGLHRRYAHILGNDAPQTLAAPDDSLRQRLAGKFRDMMKALYTQRGAHLDIEFIRDPATRSFIDAHASVLDSACAGVGMSDSMRRSISSSNYIFSGLKAFHELNEAFPSIIDENGNIKPFERFLNDVQNIDETYNRNYLRAEYNFVTRSAQMAAKWEEYAADGDDYYIQYRTQADDRVRSEHAILNRITLPPSDPFWNIYTPPNGWNCRCDIVQVRKSKYSATDPTVAASLGEQALSGDKKGIFSFNPGKERKAIPDYNPYTIRRCRDCDLAKGDKPSSGSLARFVPDNELCAACKIVRGMLDHYTEIPTTKGRIRIHSAHGEDEKTENISIAKYFAERYGHKIDLLPNPNNVTSADTHNHTLGYDQEYKVNSIATKSAIDNELRKGAKQASHIVLRIDSEIDLIELARGIKGRVKQSGTDEVIIIRNGKDLSLSREYILSRGFKIQPEDFK